MADNRNQQSNSITESWWNEWGEGGKDRGGQCQAKVKETTKEKNQLIKNSKQYWAYAHWCAGENQKISFLREVNLWWLWFLKFSGSRWASTTAWRFRKTWKGRKRRRKEIGCQLGYLAWSSRLGSILQEQQEVTVFDGVLNRLRCASY